MRKNAGMHGGADNDRAPAASLVPMAFVAAAVVVLALLVHGSRKGTIVVQRIAFSATTVQNGKTNRPAPFSVVEITETSADGTDQRDLTSNTFGRAGFQQVVAGQTIELYDPIDNTIFVTTAAGEQRAFDQQATLNTPKGSHISTTTVRLRAVRSFASGRRSVYEQQLAAGQLTVAGRVSIDGRPALKLVQSRATRLPVLNNNSGAYKSLGTIYVSPQTYDPIEEIIRSNLPGITETVLDRWQTYRVLPATSTNRRLVSLTALHPHARIVRSATAYLRASQSETRSSTRP
jgi:hypothetical protein